MRAFVDAWWRAAAHTLHPAVVLRLVLPPLLVAAAIAVAAGRLAWEPSAAWIAGWLAGWDWLPPLLDGLAPLAVPLHREQLAPVLMVAVAVTPVCMGTLLLVDWLATPAAVRFVARRRFPALAPHPRAPGVLGSVGWSLAGTLAALLALILSVPLWFVPPLLLVLPPGIWGWLVYRVLAFAALAQHADGDERRRLLRRLRWPLRTMGLACGAAGLVPSLLWAASASPRFAPLPVLLAVGLYTLIFVFASLWFAHRLLAALDASRAAPDRTSP